MIPTYEVLALRFARLNDRLRRENFLTVDDHFAPMPLDFFVFVIRGEGSLFVVDTGFGEEDARSRGRTLTEPPERVLARAGIDASSVENVVLTHMHWDHAGGMNTFRNARFHLQDAEMAYCTGRCMCQRPLRYPFEGEHVVSAVRALYAGRMAFHDGNGTLAPGITLHRIGGHSPGSQAIRVHTKRGWVVLAGDAAHYWENLRTRNPFPIIVDLPAMLHGFETLERLADSPDHIIPGHDPLVLSRFPKLNGDPDISMLHVDPC